MSDICPCCGQKMLRRLDVLLTPRKADIFDMIARNHGYIDQMLWVLFPNRPIREARKSLHVHVSQMNDILQETDYEIRGNRDGRYTLRRRNSA